MEYYPAIKENVIMPSAAPWVDIDIVILSKVSQKKKWVVVWQHLYAESKRKWYKWMYLQNRNKDLEYELMVIRGEGWGKKDN